MKHLLFLVMLFGALGTSLLFAQETNEDNLTVWEKKPHNFFLGYGAPAVDLWTSQIDGWGVTLPERTVQALGPVYFKYEYRVSYLLGVGFNFAYMNGSITEKDPNVQTSTGETLETKTTVSSYSFLMRFNVHALPYKDDVDIYAGIALGTRGKKCSYTDNEPLRDYNTCSDATFPLGMDLTLGVRFFINDNLGFYSEVGVAKSVMQFGFTGRF